MHPKVVFHTDYVAPLPTGHRFPMPKFAATFDLLRRRGLLSERNLYAPEPATPRWLHRAHTRDYVGDVIHQTLSSAAERVLGLPMTEGVAKRARAATGGTILAADLALAHGFAANLAGGSHHAFSAYGSGFCVFNDVAVAIRKLLAQERVARALVIDLDVHQGDGTADILRRDLAVTTLSLHCRTNFPAKKKFSRLDCALEPETGDRDYLALLTTLLPPLLARVEPDIVFYNAGVDPHREDKLGRLALTDAGLAERDAFVLDQCRRMGVATVAVMGGGYSDDVEHIAARHAILHAVARDLPDW